MILKIEWATELYPTQEEDNIGIAGDFPVVQVDELTRWLEGRLIERRYNNTVVNGVIDDLLAELKAAQATGKEPACLEAEQGRLPLGQEPA